MRMIDDVGLRAVFSELERRANAGLSPWSKAELASQIDVTKQAINNWSKVPAERVPMIARILGLDRGVLRPDLYEEDYKAPSPAPPLRDLPRSGRGKILLKGSRGTSRAR